jgi:hypothetical protein
MEKLSLSISETKLLIEELYNKNSKQSFYLEGNTGIGKSDLVSQLSKKLGFELFEIRLSLYEPIDLIGIGIPKDNKITFSRPDILPPENDDKKYLLFLDEFNQIDENMQSLAYQLILNHKVGTHKLPNNCLIIAAGNKIEDLGIGIENPLPLKNRFLKLNVVNVFEEWYEYALKNGIDWRIISYLQTSNDKLFDISEGIKEDNFPTPRTWFQLSELIYDINFSKNSDKFKIISNGLIGQSTTDEFSFFINKIQHIDILNKIFSEEEVKLNNHTNDLMNFYYLSHFYFKRNIQKVNIEEFKLFFAFLNGLLEKDYSKEILFLIINDINKLISKEREDFSDIFTIIYESGIFEDFEEILDTIQNYMKTIQ